MQFYNLNLITYPCLHISVETASETPSKMTFCQYFLLYVTRKDTAKLLNGGKLRKCYFSAQIFIYTIS